MSASGAVLSDYIAPPWQVPTSDGVQRPLKVTQNLIIPSDANSSDVAVLQQVANEILEGSAARLNQFLANNRQQKFLSQRSYNDRFIAMDGLRARHVINSTSERLELEVAPVGGGMAQYNKTDTNLDGYIVWVHGEPMFGSTINGRRVKCGPFAIVMNGYKIEDNFDPDLGPGNTGGYVFVFGKTALLGPSLATNPIISNPDLRKPLTLIPSPGWGVEDGPALDGTSLDKKSRELGYWVFDWLNAYNPGQYLSLVPIFQLFPPQWESWNTFFAGQGNLSLGSLTLTKGLYFPDTGNSILNPRGVNGMGVFSLSPYTPVGIIVDVWFGEFFSRAKYRTVKQSWTYAAQPYVSIKANDYPNRYYVNDLQNVEGNYTGWTANFDLSAAFDTVANLNNGPANNHMSTLGGAATDVSLTPPEFNTVVAWQEQCVQIYAEFAVTQAAALIELLQAVNNLAGAVAQAHKLAFLLRAYEGDYTLYTDINTFPDDAQWYTPPGASGPLTSGTPRAPLVQPFVQSSTIVTTYTPTPGQPGNYTETGRTITNSGPSQNYWIDVTTNADLSAYQANATTLTNTGISQEYAQTGTISDVTTGTPAGGSTTEVITYSVSDAGVPSSTTTDEIIGPAQDLTTLEGLADTFIQNTMVAYNAALAAYNAELAQVPPGLPPFPTLGNDISKFKNSSIIISGSDWSYTQ